MAMALAAPLRMRTSPAGMATTARRMRPRGTDEAKEWVTSWSAAALRAARASAAARARRMRMVPPAAKNGGGGAKVSAAEKNRGAARPLEYDSPKVDCCRYFFFFAAFFAAFLAGFFLAAIRFTTFHAVRDLPVALSWLTRRLAPASSIAK